MKRHLLMLLLGGLAAITIPNTAFATATLLLVSGDSTLYVQDGGVVSCDGSACTGVDPAQYSASDSNFLSGAVGIQAIKFNGWTISTTTQSNSPTCNGSGGPGCMNVTNINAHTSGAGSLAVYFGDTGFTTVPGFEAAVSSVLQPGQQVSQTLYAFAGSLPLASGLLSPTLTGQVGSTLTITSGVTALSTSGINPVSDTFSLVLATIFSTDAAGGSFTVNGNVAAVPEPAAVMFLGSALALCSFRLRRWHMGRK